MNNKFEDLNVWKNSFDLMHSFGSDNHSGIHPDILKAIEEANQGHQHAYGDDVYTEKAKALIKKCFGDSAEPYFVFNGTGLRKSIAKCPSSNKKTFSTSLKV